MRAAPLMATVLATLAIVPAASAQTPDQVYSPDSPAGAEYQLPLARARSEAAGLTARFGSSARPGKGKAAGGTSIRPAAPLFGVGVTPGGTSGASERSGGAGSSPDRKSPGGAAGVPAATSVPSQGLPVLSVGGSLGLVLLGGGAVGLLLTRKRRSRA